MIEQLAASGSALGNAVEAELIGGIALAVLMFILGAASKHWWRQLGRKFGRDVEDDEPAVGRSRSGLTEAQVRALLEEYVRPVEVRSRQLERNGGSHLADKVYDLSDRFDEYMLEVAKDRRQMAALKRWTLRHDEAHERESKDADA